MSRDLLIEVEQDHIESLTKASGLTAISELIWNSLDADSKEIKINSKKNVLGKFEEIQIWDNGHGLTYQRAEEVFRKLGGSEKRQSAVSPQGRAYHGKEGKGRYKSFALGSLVIFESIYNDNGVSKKFNITIERGKLKTPQLGELEKLESKSDSSFCVKIYNINDKYASEALDNRRELQEKFASYYISYPDFKIIINNQILEFDTLIKNIHTEDIKGEYSDNLFYNFRIKILEWNFDNIKKTYLCNDKGIPFLEIPLGIHSGLPISIFIESVYIEKLHRENVLNLSEMDEFLAGVLKQAKLIAKKYVRERLSFYSREFINELKREQIYPYRDAASDEVEVAKRQVFDIVALQINEYLPSFGDQNNTSKKLTLALVKEALENDTSNLQRILTEVIGLPNDKKEELSELLDKTSLVSIIDTMKEVTTRLNFLHGLELLIYDPEHSKKVLERKHLHKIVVNETWVFGDEYTYGADDLTLKNVLKQYLKDLGREDFEEVVASSSNDELKTIPDVCLWKQFNTGSINTNLNLVIELKKPTVDAGFEELKQIQSYAQKVIKDSRFPKENTKWLFILLTRDIKDEIEPQLSQQNREYGHVLQHANADVWVLRWGNVITKAKQRYKYVKEKLNLNFHDNQEALELLRNKYKQYLPDEF